MNIKVNRLSTDFNGETCFTHARGVSLPNGQIFITTQPMALGGVDEFYGVHFFTVEKDFKRSNIVASKTLVRKTLDNGSIFNGCDFTPFYHEKTNKIFIVGHSVYYNKDNHLQPIRPRETVYSVFDAITKEFSPIKAIKMDEQAYFNAGCGCGQICIEQNGDLLIPFYFRSKTDILNGKQDGKVAVMRCFFDGESITVKEIGAPLFEPTERGLGEPSIIKHQNVYYMCIRHDSRGYIAKSLDGLNYFDYTELVFADGKPIGTYSTQQHFISSDSGLYLVYTRKGADNDNVFRHRAPLFIAKVNTDNLRVIKDTEKIVVPNRGARLGNFGCCRVDDKRSLVIVSEWMQFGGGNANEYKKCMQYGSDNSIFISEVKF